jgi:hypothetical protein
MSETTRVTGWLSDLAGRARPFWPIGVVVAVITALVGIAVAWEAPHVFRSRVTAFVPATVATSGAGQLYISDMDAAINSAAVKGDVARDLGVAPSIFSTPIVVSRIRQSNVMEATLETAHRLPNAGDALSRLVARSGQSLAAPGLTVAKAQLARASADLSAAEATAVAAKKARDAFLADRQGVTPDDELAILGPQLAELRLCATGAIVPPGASRPACQQQVAKLEAQAAALGQAADELAALDRDREQAESDVQDAQSARRDAEAAVTSASAGPVAEVTEAGREISRLPSLLRRIVAILGGALLLGVAAAVVLGLVVRTEERERPDQDHHADALAP